MVFELWAHQRNTSVSFALRNVEDKYVTIEHWSVEALCFPAEWSIRYRRLDETSWCLVLNIGSCPLTVRQAPIQPAVHAQTAWKILNRKTFTLKIHLNGTWGETKKQKPKGKWEKWKQAWACLSAQADTLFLMWFSTKRRGECPPDRNVCWPHKRPEGPDARPLLINAFSWRSIFVSV